MWLDWTSSCGSYYDCKMNLSKNHQGTLEKQGSLLISPGWYIAHNSHTERSWGVEDGETECESGVLPLLGSRTEYSGFHKLILYWWILNVWGGIKLQEWKSRQVVSYLSRWVLSKKGSCTGGVAWSLCGYVFGNVFVKIPSFQVVAWQSKNLMSGSQSTKKNNSKSFQYNQLCIPGINSSHLVININLY